jgi:uncharacterized membrane protein
MKNSARSRLRQALRILLRLDFHHRILISLVVAVLVFAGAFPHASRSAWVLLSWISFAGSMILLAWGTITGADPAEVRRTARLQDAGRTLFFILVLAAACGSLLAVGALLVNAWGMTRSDFVASALIAVGAVTLSWLLVHTVFALHYAHVFYGAGEIHGTPHAGLEFPGGRTPDYMDFAYFAFVIGMTAQVSDVQITSRKLRRLALAHSIIAFAFNTLILALTINMIATVILGY